ncbi:WG repeat-containing protein [Chitinophaga sp. G-6-1-13]|uniref:WG repeat-containing protein n=1 Tax=Chitinophaga fulva TaxID=2728842 RepID=A0A848GWI9_9BACT|nr:WG repeat-containing protein [Chitinophaga fulva]NML41033.1 WG repeat-containing protein [Chitinophaga fulva]
MRKTTNRFSTCVAVILALQACKSHQPSQFVVDFVKQLDGKSLAEAKAQLEDENEKVGSFIKFMGNFKNEDKPQHFKPEEEKEGTPFSITDPAQMEEGYQLALADVGFKQKYAKGYSMLEPDGLSMRGRSLENPVFITKEIYFHDGSKQAEKLDLSEAHRVNSLKTIDSVLVEAQYSYPVKTAVIALDKQHDKADFKGTTVKLVQVKDNFVRIAMEKDAYKDYMEVEAFNKDGKQLDRTSYLRAPEGGENIGGMLKDYKKVVEGILKNLEKGAYKDIAALQKDILDKMPSETPFDDVDKGYVDAYFKGNVAKIRVHIKDGTKEGKKTMMLRNLEPNYTGMMMTEEPGSEKFGFISATTGKMEIPYNYKGLHQITPWFFATGVGATYQCYRLDTAAKQLVPLKEHIEALTADLVTAAANKEAESKFGVMTSTGQMLLPMEFVYITVDPATKLIFANKSEEDGPLAGVTTIYDHTGKAVAGPYVFSGGFEDGLLLVTDKPGNSYFINPQGVKVINLKGYYNVEGFTDGRALLKNADGKYGFLNTQGKVAIPFEYQEATKFNLGLSMVVRMNNDLEETALINTSGAVVVPFAPSSHNDTDGEGASRIYTMQNKKFDAWGKQKK